jgi:phosphomannomutase
VSALMRSVSGIRGIVGESLVPPMLLQYINAFLQLIQAKTVVIGRDTRCTGPLVEDLTVLGCSAAGVRCITLGIATTPTVEMMVPHLKASGGIIITASHNPIEWNALKFLNSRGEFLDEADIKKLFEMVDNNSFKWCDYKSLQTAEKAAGADTYHLKSVCALPFIHTGAIRKKRLRVAYDGVNGAGSSIVPRLLQMLGCIVFTIHTKPNGLFPHNPEPTPGNLKDLCKLVVDKKCDIGFATDPDGDRCAIVSDQGKAIGEEYTLVLCAVLYLKYKSGPVTVNLSTSRMIEDLAASLGLEVFRSKVGEINVSSLMKENNSVIGGEGNGGVILPELHYGRDGVLAIAMALQLLTQESVPLSQIVNSMPKYHIEKQKVDFSNKPLSNIFGRLLAKFQDAKLNELDGLRFEWPTKWVHVRASNTEPVIRIIAEAPTAKEAKSLCLQISGEI